jgi:hypothetical protein
MFANGFSYEKKGFKKVGVKKLFKLSFGLEVFG